MRVEVIGNATLYLGDCRDVLPSLTGVDAIVSDPPYGIGFKHGGGGSQGGASSKSYTRKTAPIIGDDAPFDPAPLLGWPCILFGADHYHRRLPAGGTFLAWDKSLGLGPKDSFADAEFIWTSFNTKARVFSYLWKGLLQDGEKGAPKYHISQKPIALMMQLLDLLPKGRTVCDPYMGSGTTGVAAINLQRNFIGIEIDPGHFETALRRIEDAQRQGRLFGSEAA